MSPITRIFPAVRTIRRGFKAKTKRAMGRLSLLVSKRLLSTSPDPMIKLEVGGNAPVVKYEIAEPNSYSGRNIIRLEPADPLKIKFKPAYCKVPKRERNLSENLLKTEIKKVRDFGISKHPYINKLANSKVLKTFDPEKISSIVRSGYRPVAFRTLSGKEKVLVTKVPTKAEPTLMITEVYRLTSFRGNYGAGKVLKTFSLLPGEKTTISVSSYKKSTKDTKTGSSILDSYTDETADSFETSVLDEGSLTESETEKTSMYANASASGNWGWGSAKVDAGVSKDTSSAREAFSKNVSSAVNNQSNKASSERNMQINTDSSITSEEGEDRAITRVIENINKSRTLNFVFRQMNQEYYSLLHLVDIRLEFFNNFPESKIEVPLSSMDSLLDKVCADKKSKTNAREMIINQLQSYKDYKDEAKQVIEKVKVRALSSHINESSEGLIRSLEKDEYLRFKKNMTDSYVDPETGNENEPPYVTPKVSGMIIESTKSVLRTDGVIVDSILGIGHALDPYSDQLQKMANEEKKLENRLREIEVKKVELGTKIIEENKKEESELYERLFVPKLSDRDV